MVADAGYYNGEDIVGCQSQGIRALVPKPSTSTNKAAGLFDRKDFRYEAKADQYRCPAGEILRRRHSSEARGKQMHYSRNGGDQDVVYASPTVCRACPLKPQCTTGKERRVGRWEHEAILEQAAKDLKKHPASMRQRKAIAEHPYSTIKQSMGMVHFLTRRLPGVKAEMSLHVLAYNMKRAINVLGTAKIINAL